MTTPLPPSNCLADRVRRFALGWLLLALVLAPALGRVHQIVHGLGTTSAELAANAGAHSPASRALDMLHALFAGHGSADCQVLDQQTLGGPTPAPLLALAHAAPQATPAASLAAAPVARRTAPFQARAPPGST
ncbi:hypothetical protein [Melaminivora sp.]|uniref:hypothetical protein n=1 Tax=Melaminivora sp. TaxID=1933032 RepID=UPI0028A6F685|nr:hypothetical protein [Melaminivora sp.]